MLNDSKRISEKTRERVLKCVEEFNYKPNRIAKSLRTKSSSTIGVLVEDITVWFAPDIIRGISEYAEKYDKHLLLTDLGLNAKVGNKFNDIVKYKSFINDELNLLLSTQVDGIIYVGMHDRSIDGVINRINKPMIFTYCYTDDDNGVSVSYDNINISYEIGQLFIKNGHKRIAAICGSYDSKPSYKRFCGFKKALLDADIDLDPLYVKIGNWQDEEGYKVALELLKMDKRPTAIYAMNDLMAAGVIKAAKELGISIPKDLSLVGFDNRELSYYINPTLSTVQVPLNDLGFKAADTMYQLVEKNKILSNKIIIPSRLIIRNTISTAP